MTSKQVKKMIGKKNLFFFENFTKQKKTMMIIRTIAML